MGALVRRLRRIRGDSVCLSAFSQPGLYVRGGDLVFLLGLDVPRERQEVGADHAGHCRSDAFHHASELAGLLVPPDAGQARAAVVVPGDAYLVLPIVDRGWYRISHSGRNVDRKSVEPATTDFATGDDGSDHVLV